MYKKHFFYEYSLVWKVRKQSTLKLLHFIENYSKFTTKIAFDLKYYLKCWRKYVCFLSVDI